MALNRPPDKPSKTSDTCEGSNSTFESMIRNGVAKGFFPQSDVPAIRNRINLMASKYGFSVDDFATFLAMESYGGDPKAKNADGCAGIIQFCPWGGLSLINKSYNEVLASSFLTQLDYTDTYFEKTPLPKNSDLVGLYLSVLNPASANIAGNDTDLRIGGEQAKDLYADYSARKITRNSLRSGLLKQAEAIYNCKPSSNPGIPGDVASNPFGGGGILGFQSAAFSGANCPPPPFTQQDRIIYTGCQSKIGSAQMGGSASGYGANGTLGNGPPLPNANGLQAYTGPIRPGQFIKPTNFSINSAYGMRNGRMHNGIDMAGPEGSPIYAAADGKVILVDTSGSGASYGYGTVIHLLHEGNITSIYGHSEQQFVKEGDLVKQGQIIATIGTRGRSTGPHLHFEIRPNGQPVDPTIFLPPEK